MKEVSDSGLLLGGSTVTPVRGDSTCIDSGAATSVAEQQITSEGVKAIVGGDCSGVTGAILENVALPNGIVMVSPSATSPGLSHQNNEDNGLFFRTAPSDARQGVVMTEVLMELGISEVAVTTPTTTTARAWPTASRPRSRPLAARSRSMRRTRTGKGDYSAEVGALASAGGQRLVVAGYVDQGGSGIIRAALDSGAFDTFHLPDGMIGEALTDNFGSEIDGSTGQHPGTDSPGAARYFELAAGAFDATSPFSAESYDAAALIMLAMQAAGSAESADFKDKIMDVANAPGEQILPGELAKALQILADGGEVDYVGASAVELIGPGESAGNYRQIEVKGGSIETVKYR